MPNVILIRNEYPDTRSLYHVIDYVLGKAVIRGGYGVDCDITSAKEQMSFVKQAFHKTERLQLKHFIISFAGGEAALVDFDEFLQLGFLGRTVVPRISDGIWGAFGWQSYPHAFRDEHNQLPGWSSIL